MRSVSVFAIAAALAGALLASAPGPSNRGAEAATPKRGSAPAAKRTARVVADSALGLSRTSVFSVPVPPPVVANGRQPGETKPLSRMFPGAPPRIPHEITDFVPIRRNENACVECHDRSRAPESGAVPIPESHYRDLRRAPDARRETLAGARYVCVSCHVPLTD